MTQDPFANQFREAAEEFRTFMEERHGEKPGWDFESLAAVDDFLTAVMNELETPEDREAFAHLCGAYFGELYIRNWNASWHCEGDPNTITNWSIRLDGIRKEPAYVRVFRKVVKFLDHGPVESLFALWQSTNNYRSHYLKTTQTTPPSPGGEGVPAY